MKISEVRAHFPQCGFHDVYLDSAATTLKPRVVIDRLTQFFSCEVANVHRGAHRLGDEATAHFENVRAEVAQFLNANSNSEIVFTRGTTESINLVATSLAQKYFEAGDEIVLTQLEHHSNIVPWQIWAERKGLNLKFTRIHDDGSLDFSHYQSLLSSRTKMVAMTQLSNALGVKVDLKPFIAAAKAKGSLFLVDGAQSVSAGPVDVQALDCDFLAFSGHKLFAPTGVGVLYGRLELLEDMPPFQGGGSMIDRVSESGVSFLKPPQRFEAGTPAIGEVLALGAALKFFSELKWAEIQSLDEDLLKAATQEVENLGFQVFGSKVPRAHNLSFIWPGSHSSDISTILNQSGVAVRAGHHCCQPLMSRLGIPGTVRASFSIYSNMQDVERLVDGLKKCKELLL